MNETSSYTKAVFCNKNICLRKLKGKSFVLNVKIGCQVQDARLAGISYRQRVNSIYNREPRSIRDAVALKVCAADA